MSPGSEGKISAWSGQLPVVEPLIEREIQYDNHLPRPGRLTIEPGEMPSYLNCNQSIFNRSILPMQDAHSVQMEGMLVTRPKALQTMNQYDLVPEVIYNSMEIKIRDLI